MSHFSDSEVRDLAYRLWDEAGRPDGRDLEFWLEAESRLAPPPQPARPRAAAKPKAAKSEDAADTTVKSEAPVKKAPARSRAKTGKA